MSPSSTTRRLKPTTHPRLNKPQSLIINPPSPPTHMHSPSHAAAKKRPYAMHIHAVLACICIHRPTDESNQAAGVRVPLTELIITTSNTAMVTKHMLWHQVPGCRPCCGCLALRHGMQTGELAGLAYTDPWILPCIQHCACRSAAGFLF